MRKSIFILLFALIGVFSAQAYHFEVDGIYYNIISGTDQVAVTSGTVKYSGAVVIPSSVTYEGNTYTVTSIGESAFEECTDMTSLTIPNSVTAIGKEAFYFCGDNLTSVTIGEGVTSIGENAFRNCTGLTSVTLPEGVTSIGKYAFYYCTGLTSVNIPESVTAIGEQAFRDCPGLTSVTIPNGVTYIRDGVFDGCSGLTSVTIPEGVIYLGGAFSRCSGLTSVTIPESVTWIGDGAFSGCSGLTSITIPAGVTYIGPRAFKDCSGLTSITIPAGVTYIGYEAFLNCTALTSVTCLAQTPISYSSSYPAFSVYDTLFVPLGSKAAYQTAKEWKKFSVIKDGYTVTGSVNDATMGTVSGGDTYAFGAEATLTAIPNTGYHFVKWNDGNTDNPRTLTSSRDTAFTAEFAVNIYTVTVLANDADMGTVSGGDTYAFGSSATLEAVPNPNYHFVKWSDGNTDNPRTLTVTEDITLTAEFAVNTYTVAAQPNDADMGRVDGGNIYAFGAEATLEAIPFTGYHFVKWNDGNTDNPRTLTVTKDTTLTAEFAVNTYTVAAQPNDAAMGSVVGGNTYAFGSSATLEAFPNEGYHFVKWSDGNTDNPRTLMVTCDTTFTAEFAVNIYTVTAQVNDADMGSVVGGNTYAFGSSATLEAIPNEGYHFVQWNDENTDNPRVLMVTKDTVFTAEFAVNIYTVAVQPNDADMGHVDGGNTYAFGSSATLEAVPNPGYHFVKWDDGNTDNPRTLTVTRDTAFTAEFAINTFTVSVSANNTAWGSVSPSGNGTYDSASSVTITATPNEGYRFINWTKGEVVFSTQADTTFKVTENLTLLANFEKIPDEPVATFTVSVSANKPEWGNVSQSGNGTYDSASSVTITATPNEGYRFIHWTKGNEVFTTDSLHTFVITENLELTAYFEKIPDNPTPNENPEADNFRVYVQNRTIHLSEDRGLVRVYNMAGQCVYNCHATAIPVQQGGLYIVKVGARSYKVIVR